MLIMAGLLDLPEELILLVIKVLAFSNLANLALVCKGLSDVARVGMMNRPMIFIGPVQDTYCSTRYIYGFRDFLHKYSHLINALEWLELGWEFKRLNPVYQEVLDLASTSASMRRLSIHLLNQKQLAKMTVLLKPVPGRFDSLQHIDIGLSHNEDLDATYLARLCQLPKLKDISCDFTNVTEPCSEAMRKYVEDTKGASWSPLQTLTATAEHVHTDLLKLVLPRAKKLSELYISLPSPGISNNRCFFEHDTPPFSPAGIGVLLQPVAHTLRELSISTMFMWQYNNAFIDVIRHDGSVLDLSKFSKLSYLRLSSYLLFGDAISMSKADDDIKNGISNILPPNIEQLVINFEGSQGMYVNLDDMYNGGFNFEFVQNWEEQISPEFFSSEFLTWLYKICEEKSQGGFPNLKSIILEECWCNEWDKWELFDIAELHPKLAESGLRIQILVMVPLVFAAQCLAVMRRKGFKGGIDRSHELRLHSALADI